MLLASPDGALICVKEGVAVDATITDDLGLVFNGRDAGR
jgi:hypothetical protein